MRATCEIIADIKDGKEVTYEELKMACLVQSFLLFKYQQDVKNLLNGGIASELTKKVSIQILRHLLQKEGFHLLTGKALKQIHYSF